ncbi:MAG: shikimate dehydrogenase [Gallionella sp.]|nr:shikimate dehydrogenase [Gallionella sp.]
MTDRYAVIGNPIAHSKSPLIHRMFAEQTGQDVSYEAILAPLDGFAATVERLRQEGYKGCNVTVPFKFEAFKLATELGERAQSAQAVNTLKFDGDTILGDNTDGAGLVRDLEHNLKFHLQGKCVLLVGAGGAAYGVALPLLQAGAHLFIANRTPEKADQLAIHLGRLGRTVEIYSIPNEENRKQFDLIIDATSSGLANDLPALHRGIFASGARAYDMMYGKETRFLSFARLEGAKITDGLGMLVEQAAESFHIWRGIRPDTALVIAALRKQ